MDDEELESFMSLQTHHIYVSEEEYDKLLVMGGFSLKSIDPTAKPRYVFDYESSTWIRIVHTL